MLRMDSAMLRRLAIQRNVNHFNWMLKKTEMGAIPPELCNYTYQQQFMSNMRSFQQRMIQDKSLDIHLRQRT